jgi:hypothetical protein
MKKPTLATLRDPEVVPPWAGSFGITGLSHLIGASSDTCAVTSDKYQVRKKRRLIILVRMVINGSIPPPKPRVL